MKKIIELYNFREVLMNFAIQDLKVRYKRSFFGFLWSLLNPILTMTVTSIVFSAIMRFELNNFVIFLFSGLLPWSFISISIDSSTNSLINAEGFIKKVYLPKMIFPISLVLANFINMVLSMIALFIILIFIGAKVTLTLFYLPISLLLLFFFVCGLSMILSVAAVYFRDVRHLIGVITGALFYLTPILYPLDYIPDKYAKFIEWNPFYYFIQLFRFPIYQGDIPYVSTLFICLGLTIGTFSIGYYVLVKKEKLLVHRL